MRIHCEEPVLLVPNVQYTLTASVSWDFNSDFSFYDHHCVFPVSYIPVYDDENEDMSGDYNHQEEHTLRTEPFCISRFVKVNSTIELKMTLAHSDT